MKLIYLETGLSVESKLRATKLVRELNANKTGKVYWDMKNKHGGESTNGTYTYTITNEHGNKEKSGKILIINTNNLLP